VTQHLRRVGIVASVNLARQPRRALSPSIMFQLATLTISRLLAFSRPMLVPSPPLSFRTAVCCRKACAQGRGANRDSSQSYKRATGAAKVYRNVPQLYLQAI
jgi:hypothetical protein